MIYDSIPDKNTGFLKVYVLTLADVSCTITTNKAENGKKNKCVAKPVINHARKIGSLWESKL